MLNAGLCEQICACNCHHPGLSSSPEPWPGPHSLSLLLQVFILWPMNTSATSVQARIVFVFAAQIDDTRWHGARWWQHIWYNVYQVCIIHLVIPKFMSSMKWDYNIFPAVGAVSFTGFLRWSYSTAGVMLTSTVSAFKDAFPWFFFFILDAGVPLVTFRSW